MIMLIFMDLIAMLTTMNNNEAKVRLIISCAPLEPLQSGHCGPHVMST